MGVQCARVCVILLSNPLEDTTALPTSAHKFFLQTCERAAGSRVRQTSDRFSIVDGSMSRSSRLIPEATLAGLEEHIFARLKKHQAGRGPVVRASLPRCHRSDSPGIAVGAMHFRRSKTQMIQFPARRLLHSLGDRGLRRSSSRAEKRPRPSNWSFFGRYGRSERVVLLQIKSASVT